jgi:hypothetical protein
VSSRFDHTEFLSGNPVDFRVRAERADLELQRAPVVEQSIVFAAQRFELLKKESRLMLRGHQRDAGAYDAGNQDDGGSDFGYLARH